MTKFERQNHSLSVSVYGWNNWLNPIHISKAIGQEIDLLFLANQENPEKKHYVWIKDLAHMLFKNSSHKERKHPFRLCLHVLSTQGHLETPKMYCKGIGEKPQCIVMSEEDKNIL